MSVTQFTDRFKLGLQLFTLRCDLAIRVDDTFLVSYPKSGNTWTRFLVANLRYPEEAVDFGTVDRLVPNSEVLEAWRIQSPRIFKSHETFRPNFPNVVYIVRDPRDVAVSEFHFSRKRRLIPDNCSIQTFVRNFVGNGWGAYGSWAEHFGSWIGARFGHPRFLLLRYEDMVRDTGKELRKISSFLGLPESEDRIRTAIEHSSPVNMRRLEQATGDRSPLTRKGRRDMPFVRSAKFGDWKSELPEESVARIEEAWGSWMRWLQYEISCERPMRSFCDTTSFLPGNLHHPVVSQ